MLEMDIACKLRYIKDDHSKEEVQVACNCSHFRSWESNHPSVLNLLFFFKDF